MASNPVAADGRSRTLADGTQIPVLGLGVWQVPDGPECVNAVRWALLSQEDVLGHVVEHSLKRLGLEYVDLYLVHWPQGGPLWAWPGMERAHERGHARSIGVSNFSVAELQSLLATAGVAPVADQVQLSPFEYRRALIEGCQQRNVAIEAYSPLGTGRHLSNPAVDRVAQHVGRTPAQVLLRWSLQHGLIVLPKSTHRERIEENAQVFDFVLSDQDMADLDARDGTGGTDLAVEHKWW